MTKELHDKYPALYGKNVDVEEMDARFASLISDHKDLFGKSDPLVFSAAGRTEIAGNHTDHNQGKVIGAAINLDTIAAVSARDDSLVTFVSQGFPKCTIDISDLEIKEEEKILLAEAIETDSSEDFHPFCFSDCACVVNVVELECVVYHAHF